MLPDTPAPDAVPTRRSGRTAPTPVQATPETTEGSRAERRRRDAAGTAERPAVVWGRTAEPSVESATPIVEIAAASATVILDAREDAVEAVILPEPRPQEVVPPTRRSARAQRAEAPVAEPEIGPAALAAPTPLPRRETLRTATVEPEAPVVLEPVLTPAEPFELLEPEAPVAETIADEPKVDASALDDFEAAARLFSFTGETAIITEAPAEDSSGAAEAAIDEAAPHVVPRGASRRRVALKRIAATSFSIGVMGIVGLLTVGLTTPAEAVAAAGGNDVMQMSVAPGEVDAEAEEKAEIQAYVAPASIENVDVARSENYATVSMAEIARESGISHVSNLFVNDPNAPIQWPFAVGVPMSYGFGMRSGAMHQGIDFTPGAGSPIQAIADGTVRVASNSGGAYGVHVIIDHVIDGQLISSHYAHMQYGSLQVAPGQQVAVGTVLGRTGNTGRSFGAHTHFEILAGGTTPIDPLPWLREHTGG